MRTLVLLLSLFITVFAVPALADEMPGYAEQAERLLNEGIEKAFDNNGPYRTPVELTGILDQYFKKLDTLLNQTWKETHRYLKNAAPQLVEQLLADQRAWLKFAENFSGAVYTGFGQGGSMYRSTGVEAKMRLWTQRIKYLDSILAYVSEVHGAPEK